jgi:hypothetical protein
MKYKKWRVYLTHGGSRIITASTARNAKEAIHITTGYGVLSAIPYKKKLGKVI